MNLETVEKVGEIIKNINVGFDGNLNSETLISMTKNITNYLWMVQIKSLVVHGLWAFAIVVSAFLIGKTLLRVNHE